MFQMDKVSHGQAHYSRDSHSSLHDYPTGQSRAAQRQVSPRAGHETVFSHLQTPSSTGLCKVQGQKKKKKMFVNIINLTICSILSI